MSSMAVAQGWQWSRHFGGPGHDYGQIGAVDAAGNVYCIGHYAGSGPGTYHNLYIGEDTLLGTEAGFLVKYNSSGTLMWSMNIACTNANFAASVNSLVLDTASNALIITGGHSSACTIGTVALPDSGAYLAKVDLDGTCFWATNIGTVQTAGLGLVLNEVGELYVSGGVFQGGTSYIGNESILPGSFLAKFAADGAQLWAKSLIPGTTSAGYPRNLPYTLQCHSGLVYVYGPCFGSANGDLITIDTITVAVTQGVTVLAGLNELSGIAEWVQTFGEANNGTYGYDNSMGLSNEGSIYCMGYIYSDTAYFGTDTAVVAPPNGLSYLVKYSASGELLHLHTYERVGSGGIHVTDDGSLLLIGNAISTPTMLDACDVGQGLFVMRMDSLGNCINMIGTGYATGTSILQTPQGIYLAASSIPQGGTTTFAGESVTSYGFEDVLLAKLDLALGVQSLVLDGNDALHIYANPNQGSFQVQVPDALVNAPHLDLKIYDATGRLVLAQSIGSGDEHPQFDLYGIGAGFYAVTLSNGQRVYHGNMVVE
jgi:hypothetical protein